MNGELHLFLLLFSADVGILSGSWLKEISLRPSIVSIGGKLLFEGCNCINFIKVAEDLLSLIVAAHFSMHNP